jgi:hypothetical protein
VSGGLHTQLRIDSAWLGSYAYRAHHPPSDTVSRPYAVTPGQHVIGAQVAVFNGYIWADTTITFAPGDALSRTLSLECDLP